MTLVAAKMWSEVALGDICELKYGKSLPQTQRRPGVSPVFGSNGPVGWHDSAITAGPTIVIGRKGSVGEVSFSEIPCWPIDTTYYIDDRTTRVDLRWLFYRLRNLSLARLNKAAAVPGLNRDDVYRSCLLLPPIKEQRRIAEVLDRAEALRAMRREALTQLDTLTQSIFIDLFGDPATNPREWPQSLLNQITRKITDGEHLNPTFVPTGMPMIMAGNVMENGVDIDGAKRVEMSVGDKFRRKCNPERGDILLVSRGATIGRSTAIDDERPFCLMGSVILIKLDGRRIDSRYLKAFLRDPHIRHVLYKTSGSSAQQAIYLKDLKNLNCMIPPRELQAEFVRRTMVIDSIKTAYRESLRHLDALFASLQDRAFKGTLWNEPVQLPAARMA